MSDACGCGHDEPRAEGEEEHEIEKWWQVTEIRAAAAAGVLLIAALTVRLAGGPDALGIGFEAGALIIAGYTFVPSTLTRLAKGKIGVGTLMTIAAVGAVLLGEVGEAAMLAFLFAISEGLEEYAVTRTRRGLRALLSLVPDTATVLRGGREETVPPSELELGEVMIVKPGERIATDGIIRSGRTALDTSAITGESMPVEAGPGDEVFAGSINGTGVLEVEVTADAQDNSLAKIVRIVEAEQSRKGEAQRLADKIAKPLVPGVMIVAAAIAAVGSMLGDPLVWIERALVVLVAASPCALAIAIPVTVVAAIGAASKLGVLVKGGAALEALGRIRTVALDKTGTLTRNQPAVIDVATANGADRGDVLAVAAALEARSEHPLARAILAAVEDYVPADDVDAVTGAGLTGYIDGIPVRLGRPGWIDPGPLAGDIERMQHAGATAVLIERAGTVIGAVAVRDELRPEAREVVAGLRRGGYTVAMLTGDNRTHRPSAGRRRRHRRRARRPAPGGQGTDRGNLACAPPDGNGRGRCQRRPRPGHRRLGHCHGRDGIRRGHRDRRCCSDGRRPAAPAAGVGARAPLPDHHAAERRTVAGDHHRPDAVGLVRGPRPGRRGPGARGR